MEQAPEIRVALAGLGTVGRSVIRLLQEESSRYREELGISVRVSSILDRSYARKDLSWVGPGVKVTDSVEEFLQAPSDIVVELIGGSEPADQIINQSLIRKKAVVTANKLLVARCGEHYMNLALENNVYFGFEACVAGGIPIIRVLQRCLFADRIVRLRGILNGTCNFILSEMDESGRSFEEILGQAQALGYAEADPTLDVSGRDTRDKIAILSALSFGTWVNADNIPTHGIAEINPVDFLYARKLNATIKLLGSAEDNGSEVLLRVSPFLIPYSLPLSKISGVFNAVEVTGVKVGTTVFSGRGAGGNPTAVSVVADILNAGLAVSHKGPRIEGRGSKVARPSLLHPRFSILNQSKTSEQVRAAEVYPFYIRFFVADQPGIIAALSGILARLGINIDSVIQEHWPHKSNLPFIITVEPTAFSTLQQAVAEMSKLPFNNLPPRALPILTG